MIYSSLVKDNKIVLEVEGYKYSKYAVYPDLVDNYIFLIISK